MIKIFRFCKPYFSKFRLAICVLAFICMFLNLSNLLIPYVLGNIIDVLNGGNSFSIFNYIAIFFVLLVAELAGTYLAERLYLKLQMNSAKDINVGVINHIQKLDLSYIEGKSSSFLNNQVNADSNSITIFALTVIQDIVTKGGSVLIPIIILFSFDYRLSVALILLGLVYIAVYYCVKKNVFRASYDFLNTQALFFKKLNDQLFFVKFIKMQGIASKYIYRLQETFNVLLKNILREQRVSYPFTLVDVTALCVANIVTLIIGAHAVRSNHMTIGQLSISFAYFNTALTALRYFFSLGKETQGSLVACDRLNKILSVKNNETGEATVDHIDKVTLEGIDFSYGDNAIFDNASMRFEKGKIYTLIGENGCGKSTLLKLIIGLYYGTYNGVIKYNESDIKTLDMETMRRCHIGVCEQEPILLNESIRYNLQLENDTLIDEDELEKYISLFNLSDTISALKEGLDTIVDENVTNLSGGEKQKLSLMRAFLKHPSLIILDEPTSALDADGRKTLTDILLSFKSDAIIILSTHDSELLEISDEIVDFGKYGFGSVCR